jgi:hypothetical protein
MGTLKSREGGGTAGSTEIGGDGANRLVLGLLRPFLRDRPGGSIGWRG